MDLPESSSGSSGPYSDIGSVEKVTEEWTYTMRRTMQQIVPNLFLGPYASAGKKQLQELKNVGITHIVCVRQEVEKNLIKPNHPNDFQYLVVNLADSFTENILKKIPEVKQFIDGGLASGGKVLVHCNSGMCTSPSLVIAYIMQTYGLDFQAALQHVQQRRFCIQPNEAFEHQLQEFEPIYKARVDMAGMGSSEGHKRGRDAEEDDEDEDRGKMSRDYENMDED